MNIVQGGRNSVLNDEQRKALRAYYQEYYAQHRETIKENQRRYVKRRAERWIAELAQKRVKVIE